MDGEGIIIYYIRPLLASLQRCAEVWGYDNENKNHSRFEAETHTPDLRFFQNITDVLFRSVQEMDDRKLPPTEDTIRHFETAMRFITGEIELEEESCQQFVNIVRRFYANLQPDEKGTLKAISEIKLGAKILRNYSRPKYSIIRFGYTMVLSAKILSAIVDKLKNKPFPKGLPKSILNIASKFNKHLKSQEEEQADATNVQSLSESDEEEEEEYDDNNNNNNNVGYKREVKRRKKTKFKF